jgi:hypothetical protein
MPEATETPTMSRPRPSIPAPKTLRQEGLLDYAVHRLDYAVTLLGCTAKELVAAGDTEAPEAPAILYLYEILRNEVENLRDCVERWAVGRGGDR